MISPPERAARPPIANICEPTQLLVEGEDDRRVFKALLKHMSIDGIQIQKYGGKDNLRNFLRILVEDEDFGVVQSIGVHRDADTDANSAGESVKHALSDCGLPTPNAPIESDPHHDGPRVAYIVVPHGESTGSIEDVCIGSIGNQAVMSCVEKYMECLRGESSGTFVASSKARTYAYLSSLERPHLRVGEAAEARRWDFDADSFEPLRRFLKLL